MTTVELWSPGIGVPGAAAAQSPPARETRGGRASGIVDSQCLSGDTYVAAGDGRRGDVDAAGWRPP